MSYVDGYRAFPISTADTRWPTGVQLANTATQSASPTGVAGTNCILRKIIPLKKTANGTVTLQVARADGTAYTGLIWSFTADSTFFLPKTIEPDIELTDGLSVTLSSTDMAFLIVWEYKSA
jgi:hypothetical protein